MTISNNDTSVSERLRQLVTRRFGRRRKFILLEQESNISASKWKNFFYQKQDASNEMVHFWAVFYPEDAQWLCNGFSDLNGSNNPFSVDFPTLEQRLTLQERLKWVISEWCSQTGTKIFKHLELKSAGKIAAIDWLQMAMGQKTPTLEMVEFICSKRPHFSTWVLLGASHCQVNPTDEISIKNWMQNSK